MPKYRFGRFVIDDRVGEVRVDGRPVHLQPKVYDLLLLLVRQPGVLFSQQELVKSLWPDVHVSESSLTQLVRRLRTSLGSDDIPLTVPKRGYRLTETVTVEPDEPSPAPLPSPTQDALVGRDAIMEHLRAQMTAPRFIVTLHGPGGIGKTRIARAVAGDRLWISLRSARTRDAFIQITALAADVSLPESQPPMETLARALSAVPLVFDEAETVYEPLAELLGLMAAPRVLVTSRVLLGCPGEHPVDVPPLSPALARALWLRLVPSSPDPELLDRLLSRLDYHPLAIELAAARAPLMRIEPLLRRIEVQGLVCLDRDAHGSSMADIAETSWSAISEVARRAAILITSLPAPISLEDLEIIDTSVDWFEAMEELRKCAWLRSDGSGFSIPTILAERVRHYLPVDKGAQTRAISALLGRVRRGEHTEISHLLWALEQSLSPEDHLPLAAAALCRLRGLGQFAVQTSTSLRALDVLSSIHCPDPIEAAELEYEASFTALQSERHDDALALCDRALCRDLPHPLRAQIAYSRIVILGRGGRMGEAREQSAQLLAWAESEGSPEVLYEGITAAIGARNSLNQPVDDLIERGLQLAKILDDPRKQHRMIAARAWGFSRAGQFAKARLDYEIVLSLCERYGPLNHLLDAEDQLADTLARLGQHALARERFEGVIARATRAGQINSAMKARGNLGRMLMDIDDPCAESTLLEVLADAERLNMFERRGTARFNLGILYRKRSDSTQAEACFSLCLDQNTRLANLARIELAEIALERGLLDTAEQWVSQIPPDLRSRDGELPREHLSRRVSEARQRVLPLLERRSKS